MISATVIKAKTPRLLKDGTPQTKFVSITINISTGDVHAVALDTLSEAEIEFANKGDPPMWRGLQIIQVEAR